MQIQASIADLEADAYVNADADLYVNLSASINSNISVDLSANRAMCILSANISASAGATRTSARCSFDADSAN